MLTNIASFFNCILLSLCIHIVILKCKTYLQAFSGQESSFVLYFLHNTKQSLGPDLPVGPRSPASPAPVEVYGKIYPTFSSCEII